MPMRMLRLCLVLGGLSFVLAAAVWVEARAFGLESVAWRPCACTVFGQQPARAPVWGAGARPRGLGRGPGVRCGGAPACVWD